MVFKEMELEDLESFCSKCEVLYYDTRDVKVGFLWHGVTLSDGIKASEGNSKYCIIMTLLQQRTVG